MIKVFFHKSLLPSCWCTIHKEIKKKEKCNLRVNHIKGLLLCVMVTQQLGQKMHPFFIDIWVSREND